MTNSYNLFPKVLPKIIILHGMNNNMSSFVPLMEVFKALGHDVYFLPLPGHGDNRFKSKDFKSAFKEFDLEMTSLAIEPYVVIAFSHGALYFQLWLEKHPQKRPLAQVLLAPALYINRQETIEKVLKFLPSFMMIKSVAPRKFRRYHILRVWEYEILVHGMKTYQKHVPPFKVPTLILIDPKDELVSADILGEKIKEQANPLVTFEKWNRDYLRKGPGQHHLIFHPEYFSKEDWKNFTERIQGFVKGTGG